VVERFGYPDIAQRVVAGAGRWWPGAGPVGDSLQIIYIGCLSMVTLPLSDPMVTEQFGLDRVGAVQSCGGGCRKRRLYSPALRVHRGM